MSGVLEMRGLLIVFLSFAMMAVSFTQEPVWAQEEGEALDEGKLKITFEPFHLSLLDRGRVRGTVDIQLVLQLHENTDYDKLNAIKPQLRADITSALSTLARQRWSLTRPIDPDIVSAYLKPFIDHRVGGDKLDIYVVQALINPN